MLLNPHTRPLVDMRLYICSNRLHITVTESEKHSKRHILRATGCKLFERLHCISYTQTLMIHPPRSRLNISHRLWEAHPEEHGALQYDEGNPAPERPSQTKSDSVMEREYDSDEELLYDIVESFLFDTEPILALQTSIKAILEPVPEPSLRIFKETTKSPHKSSGEIISNFLARNQKVIELHVANLLHALAERPLASNKTRLRWTCVSRTGLLRYLNLF